MFNTVVVASDASPASDAVVDCLHGLKPLGTRKAVLLHALGIHHLKDMAPELARVAEPKLQAQEASLREQGFETTLRVIPGILPLEINQVAREEGASLIAIGSHGATMAADLLIGGVALQVLHRAEFPVMVFRLRIVTELDRLWCEATCGGFERTVLYATDFSDSAEQALPCLEEIIRRGARRVTLLHVQERTRIHPHLAHRLEEFNRIDEGRLQRMKEHLVKLDGIEVDTRVVYGSPVEEILHGAEHADASLIVMGTQGRGFLGKLLLGSVSHQVARQAKLPVLFVPSRVAVPELDASLR